MEPVIVTRGLTREYEGGVKAWESRFTCVAQVDVAEQAPNPDRQLPHQRLLDPTKPAHEPRGEPARQPIGQQEVQVLLRTDPRQRAPERRSGNRHHAVSRLA